MKEITYFYLARCPYCRKTDRLIEQLVTENPKFAEIKITKIEESQNPQMAGAYDYHYVPCLWIGDRKLHEGAATKEQIQSALQAALEED